MRVVVIVLALALGVEAQTTPREQAEACARAVATDLDRAELLCTLVTQSPGEYTMTGFAGLYTIWDQRGQPEEAIRLFHEYYEKTQNLEILSLGVTRLAAAGHLKEAQRELEPLWARVNKGEKVPPIVTLGMSVAERRLGHLDLALDAGRRAEEGFQQEHSPRLMLAGDNVAALLLDMGRTLEALDEYEYLIGEFPTAPGLLNNYAYYLAVHNKQLERALGMSRQAVAAQPNNAMSLDTLGFILGKLGKTEEAIDAMVRSFRAGPNSTLARSHLAQVLAKRKDQSPAMQDLLDALRTEPTPQNSAEIGRLLAAIGE